MTTRYWMLAFFAACGEVQGVPVDPDAAPPEPDATDLRVHVRVLGTDNLGLPDPLAKVLFQGPDGALVHDGQVDADGAIAAELPAGGSVTAIQIVRSSATEREVRLSTFAGVKPGDQLYVGTRPTTVGPPGNPTAMTATFTPIAGASTHFFYTSCDTISAPTSPATVTLRDGCHGATFDLFAFPALGPFRYAYMPNVPYVPGGNIVVPPFQLMEDCAMRALNTPAAIDQLTFKIGTVLEGRTVWAASEAFMDDPPAGTVVGDIVRAPGVGTRSEFGVFFRRPDSSSQHTHEGLVAFTPREIDMNLAILDVPFLTAVVATPTGATWRAVTPGVTPDGMHVLWTGRWVEGPRTTQLRWSLVQPSSLVGISLPRLPPAYREFDPQDQTAVVPGTGQVRIVDYDVVESYDQLRQGAHALFESSLTYASIAAGKHFVRRIMSDSIAAP